jgi:hypothetical protein
LFKPESWTEILVQFENWIESSCSTCSKFNPAITLNTCLNHSYILISRWIILIKLSDDFNHYQEIWLLSKHAISSFNWRFNDFIYFSIKFVVITYINHKMMKYWTHTKK